MTHVLFPSHRPHPSLLPAHLGLDALRVTLPEARVFLGRDLKCPHTLTPEPLHMPIPLLRAIFPSSSLSSGYFQSQIRVALSLAPWKRSPHPPGQVSQLLNFSIITQSGGLSVSLPLNQRTMLFLFIPASLIQRRLPFHSRQQTPQASVPKCPISPQPLCFGNLWAPGR